MNKIIAKIILPQQTIKENLLTNIVRFHENQKNQDFVLDIQGQKNKKNRKSYLKKGDGVTKQESYSKRQRVGKILGISMQIPKKKKDGFYLGKKNILVANNFILLKPSKTIKKSNRCPDISLSAFDNEIKEAIVEHNKKMSSEAQQGQQRMSKRKFLCDSDKSLETNRIRNLAYLSTQIVSMKTKQNNKFVINGNSCMR